MAEHKRKKTFGSLQPDIEDILSWNELPGDAFEAATTEERENFIQDRKSVSYWADAWRRLRKNTVAMVALCIVVIIALFAFIGPMVVPYTYKQQVRGSESLHPWHYSLEDQKRISDYLEEHNGAGKLTPDEAVEKARAEAAAAGKTLSRVEEAKIRAQANVSQGQTAEEVTQADAVKALGIQSKPFGYSMQELQRKAAGEDVFPHVFGTDEQGRDIMVRVMVGARVSIIVGVCAALLVLVIGALYGSISGYCGGKVDLIMMRIVDIIYSLPDTLMVILLSVVLNQVLGNALKGTILAQVGTNMLSLFVVFGLLYWVSMARLVRGQILSIKTNEYVLAARALGAKPGRIIRKHILPNCISVIFISVALQIPSAIFTESFLSFIGLGVQAPMPSLGSLANAARGGMQNYPWKMLFPALSICLIVLSFNLLGDGLRDAFDRKLRR